MIILGIDLEGINENLFDNGVNTKVDRVIEIGAVLWQCEGHQPLKIYSELVDEPDRLPLSQEVVELTGITEKILDEWALKGEQIKMALERLALIMKKADYYMAHNGEKYDRPMLESMFTRFEVAMPEKVWIDTQTDVEYPRKIHHLSMAALEHAHGFINPFPHRAVTDVLAMLKVASNYDYLRMAQLAESPKLRIVADLGAPNWKDKAELEQFNKIKSKVSRAKFQWNPQKKVWTKLIHKILIDEEKINFDFDWHIIDK